MSGLDNYISRHIHTSDEKLQFFGNGEWVEEVDEVFFTYNEIECKILRIVVKEPYNPTAVFGGHLCGYCKVPEVHPYYKKEWDEVDIDAHGGLTDFQLKDDGYWIGFDCAHCFDITPSMQKFYIEVIEELKTKFHHVKNSPILNRQYRNISYCVEQCKSIVEQLLESIPINSEKE